jgi:hypothetical protein
VVVADCVRCFNPSIYGTGLPFYSPRGAGVQCQNSDGTVLHRGPSSSVGVVRCARCGSPRKVA